jgi:hypothetical protein
MCTAVCYLNVTVIWVSLIVVSHSGTSVRTMYASRRISIVDLCLCNTLCLLNMQTSYKCLFPWSKVLLQKLTVTQLVNKTRCQNPRSDIRESSPQSLHVFKIRFNIILLSTLTSPKWSIPFTFKQISYESSNRIHK